MCNHSHKIEESYLTVEIITEKYFDRTSVTDNHLHRTTAWSVLHNHATVPPSIELFLTPSLSLRRFLISKISKHLGIAIGWSKRHVATIVLFGSFWLLHCQWSGVIRCFFKFCNSVSPPDDSCEVLTWESFRACGSH